MDLEIIKQRAKISGKTIKSLAKECKMSREKLSRIINGKIDPKLSDVEDILLKVDLELRILLIK